MQQQPGTAHLDHKRLIFPPAVINASVSAAICCRMFSLSETDRLEDRIPAVARMLLLVIMGSRIRKRFRTR